MFAMGSGRCLRPQKDSRRWILMHNSNGWLQERNDYWFKAQEWADKVKMEQ